MILTHFLHCSLSFELFPAVFEDIYGFSSGVASLPFLAVAVGVLCGYASVFYYEKGYRKTFEANGNKPCPEERLLGLFIGAPMFTAGLWWFGWGSNSNSFVVSLIAGVPLGYGIFHTFQSCINYLADVYQSKSLFSFSSDSKTIRLITYILHQYTQLQHSQLLK